MPDYMFEDGAVQNAPVIYTELPSSSEMQSQRNIAARCSKGNTTCSHVYKFLLFFKAVKIMTIEEYKELEQKKVWMI